MKLDNVSSFPLYFEGLIRPIYEGLNLSFHLAEKKCIFLQSEYHNPGYG